MARVERFRELITTIPTAEHWRDKMREGWRPVAIEWERELSAEELGDSTERLRQPPYGLRVAADCCSLENDPHELEALSVMLEGIVSDRSLTEVAEELNRRGFTTRSGSRWTQVLVFHMLPRLIEVAPEISSSTEWSARMSQLGVMAARVG